MKYTVTRPPRRMRGIFGTPQHLCVNGHEAHADWPDGPCPEDSGLPLLGPDDDVRPRSGSPSLSLSGAGRLLPHPTRKNVWVRNRPFFGDMNDAGLKYWMEVR